MCEVNDKFVTTRPRTNNNINNDEKKIYTYIYLYERWRRPQVLFTESHFDI